MKNAKAGFGKLFTAELLVVIASLDALVPNKYWFFSIVFIALSVIAFFIEHEGLKLLAKDNSKYRKAYLFAMVGIILDIIAVILEAAFKPNSNVAIVISDTFEVLSEVIELVVCYIVLQVSVSHLKSIDNNSLAKYANTTKYILIFVYVVTILLDVYISVDFISLFALLNVTMLSISAVFLIIGHLRYIVFLKRMKDSL